MNAYSVPFKTTCDQRGCCAGAAEELFNTYNASLGSAPGTPRCASVSFREEST
mgnify:CR=1 FL=1